MKWKCCFLISFAMGLLAFSSDSRADALFSGANEYSFMWWAEGLRHSSKVFNIQTSRYGLSFDYDHFNLLKFGPIPNAPSEDQALIQNNSVIQGLYAAQLRCFVEQNGTKYAAVSASSDTAKCMLVESGKFIQRRWLEGIVLESGAPVGTMYLEMLAWPDRLSLVLYFTPDASLSNAALVMELDVDALFSQFTVSGQAQALMDTAGNAGYVVLTDHPSANIVCDTAQTKATLRLPISSWTAGVEQSVALIVYPIANNCAAELANIASIESAPLTITAQQTKPQVKTLTCYYSKRYGWYHVGLRNDSCGTNQESGNNRIERVNFSVSNPYAIQRPLRMSFYKENGVCQVVGISAMLCDSDYHPLGIPMQLSKNWHNGGDHRFDRVDWFRGSTMIGISPQSTLNLNYTSVGAHWGGVAAASHAQLCLIGWGGNQLWEESAIGSWGESITYDPDVCLNRSMIDDVRPLMVYAMNSNTPVKWRWTNNVGGGDFLAYWNTSGTRLYNTRMRTLHRKNCPVLTETVYAGRGAGGAMELQCTAQLYRTDDMVRGVYRLRYDVISALPVAANPEGNKKRIAFFQLGADNYNNHNFEKMARGNIDGLIEEWSPVKGGKTYSRVSMPCPGRMPWFSLHQANSTDTSLYGAWANRGLIIRSYKARLGGADYTVPYVSVYGTEDGGYKSANIELAVPEEITQLAAGDYVEAELVSVIVPQFAADYYGPNAALAAALTPMQNTWQMIYREAIGNDYAISVQRGTLERNYPMQIRACNGIEFEVTGGCGYVPMSFTGLYSYRDYALQEYKNGQWQTINQAVHGNDFWQTNYDSGTQTWTRTYSAPLDTPGDVPITRRFRLTGPGLWNGNLNCDRRVDGDDLLMLSAEWLNNAWQITAESQACNGWWKLDESAGTIAADASDALRHATVNKATAWTAGRYGGALAFDGATTVAVPASAASGLTDQVSVCLWVYGDQTYQPQNQDVVFHASAPGASRILLSHLPWIDGQIIWDAGYADGSYDRIAKQALPEDYKGRWNHWVFTKNTADGTMKMYLNGQLWHSGQGKTKTLAGATQFAIGSYSGANGAFYRGMIDDFRIYDLELTPDEVSKVYQGLDPFEQVECTSYVQADLNRDCVVDLRDVQEFAKDWLLTIDD